MNAARTLFPAIRWDPTKGYAPARQAIDDALAQGVGGFVLFGGEAAAVRELTGSLRARTTSPMLIGADLERGAGQQFKGAVQLPPLAAIGALDDLGITRQAASLTAREALALGINWVFAPVADLDIEPRNPIVGTRSFGADPVRVAAHVTAWIEGCRAEGALCCAKHFPGHGRTVDDSHAVLPVVTADRATLEMDLTPFRAAVIAGADAIMTAHVAFPAFDPSGSPATLSAPILDGLLRRELGFEGLIVTDALIMQGVLDAGGGHAGASVMALKAGCDALLYPADPTAVQHAIDRDLGNGLSRSRVARALGRLSAAAAGAPSTGTSFGRAADAAWALGIATRAVSVQRGEANAPREFDLLTVDDDVGGPYPAPTRAPFLAALRESGFDPRPVEHVDGQRAAVIAVYADIRAWKGRPGLSHSAVAALDGATRCRPDATVVLFGHARLASEVPGSNLVVAWGGETIMQTAAARWLASETTPPSAA
jgi:beta-glucosidase-like glycosyl hydrolase